MYQRIGASAFKKDLTNIRKLCDVLGNPQNTFKSIHVAGTTAKDLQATYYQPFIKTMDTMLAYIRLLIW